MEDFLNDEILMKTLQPAAEQTLQEGLERAVQDNILLKAIQEDEVYYFLNSPRGRAAVQAMQQGDWLPDEGSRQVTGLRLERPNIFRLYEENIGPLTPLISETLQDAEQTYPAGWIEEAVQIAVEKNVRNWRYIDAILKSWQKEGRSEKDRRDSQEDRRKYIEGEFGDIIEH